MLKQDRLLGLIAVALGVFVALYWAGADSETGLIERIRGRASIGDALAPTIAGALMAAAGLWLVLAPGRDRLLSGGNVAFLVILLLCLAAGLGLMRWVGPWLVEISAGTAYRPLRDTVPWKYAGFLIGGTALIAALIALVERRLRWSRLLIALGVTVALMLFYDLPFDDLLLPPNGDV